MRADETAAAAETPISEQAKAINDLAKAQGLPEPLPPGSAGNPGHPPNAGDSGSSGGCTAPGGGAPACSAAALVSGILAKA